ncbi:MAG: M48 family metallopeptidase [Ferruginibacter sp.]
MKSILVFAGICLVIIGCSTNAITGRKQLSLFPESTLQQEAVTQYRSFLNENKVMNNADAAMVKKLGSRVAAAIRSYYTKQGKTGLLNGYNWEFNLVDDKQVNAWCMPGGKVVVYSGLLAVTKNEAALAIVLGHEITHAIAGHSNERMSQVALAQGLGTVGNAFTQNRAKANAVFNNVYAPAASVGVLLPNSRKQEYEADRFGLIFAAIAGYNPKEAIPFWQRMIAASDGNKPPEFLSSHPGDESRITQLKKYMPEAMKYYKPSK